MTQNMIFKSIYIADKEHKLLLFIFLFITITSLHSQNTNCLFQSSSYYFASAIGTDKKAEQQAFNYLLKAIFPSFQSRFNQVNFNRIISRCGIIRYCHDGNKQTIAYASKASCASCFLCQPTFNVTFSNIDDNSSKSQIQNNTIDFLTTIYCDFDQFASLKLNKFLISTSARDIIDKLWKLNAFRCEQKSLNLSISKNKNIFEIEQIPIIFRNPKENPENVRMFCDLEGRILDFSFMVEVNTLSNKVNQDIKDATQRFIENLKIEYIIKDSSQVIKLLNGGNHFSLNEKQAEYIENIMEAFRDKELINFTFQDIELCQVVTDPTLYSLSIKQHWPNSTGNSIDGYLTLLLIFNSQNNKCTVNNFSWSKTKIDPCFPY
jgi:hypothetical protein